MLILTYNTYTIPTPTQALHNTYTPPTQHLHNTYTIPTHHIYKAYKRPTQHILKTYTSFVFSKIIDNCILIMQSDSLQSDPLQFAYKEMLLLYNVHLLFMRCLITILIIIVVFTRVCWIHQKHLTV